MKAKGELLTFIYTDASALNFVIILYTLLREGPLHRDYAKYEYGRYEYGNSLKADTLTDSNTQINITVTRTNLVLLCTVTL